MNLVIPLHEATRSIKDEIGEKAWTLARLSKAGWNVPPGYALPAGVYHQFIQMTGLAEMIFMELERKDFESMRWEEIWDISLRIRSHFLRVEWPDELKAQLHEDARAIAKQLGTMAARSSGPGEDSRQHSFAGLHESRIMLHSAEELLEAIRIVWASLWSDGALLYRQDLGLDPSSSAMAVVVQQMIVGEHSGVLFSRAPDNPDVMAVEAVRGLNQGLVDGSVDPDRWIIRRGSFEAEQTYSAPHRESLQPTEKGVAVIPENGSAAHGPLLAPDFFVSLAEMASRLEDEFGAPVDIEWTVKNGSLFLLQARPITAINEPGSEDLRPWYLSLHRSLPNLENLREELEEHILPGMQGDAERMSSQDIQILNDEELAEEIRRRQKLLRRWQDTYRDKCIPMAHGIRLFAEFYAEMIKDEDPYGFLSLLHSDKLLATMRNRLLMEMAGRIREEPRLRAWLDEGQGLLDHPAGSKWYEKFLKLFGEVDWITQGSLSLEAYLIKLAETPPDKIHPPPQSASSEDAFFRMLPKDKEPLARRLLRIAKASYTLRDNDNLYLGKVRSQTLRAEEEARRRLVSGNASVLREVLDQRSDPNVLFAEAALPAESSSPDPAHETLARQLVGQPAGRGLASGPARVLSSGADFADFSAGEVLVCDAIEPNMTFLVPLAAAIVERRGGMLVHGAIIAREYGIPCVTGIREASRRIRNGDHLTVDGFLGIVTIERSPEMS